MQGLAKGIGQATPGLQHLAPDLTSQGMRAGLTLNQQPVAFTFK